jgi:hypothetical protein
MATSMAMGDSNFSPFVADTVSMNVCGLGICNQGRDFAIDAIVDS